MMVGRVNWPFQEIVSVPVFLPPTLVQWQSTAGREFVLDLGETRPIHLA